MDPLIAAWLNVQWLVYNWFSGWWNTVNASLNSIESSGR